MREKLGLNAAAGGAVLSLHRRTSLQLDFGRSLVNGRPVLDDDQQTPCRRRCSSASSASFFSFVIAVPLGTHRRLPGLEGQGRIRPGPDVRRDGHRHGPGLLAGAGADAGLHAEAGLLPATGPMEWGDPISLAKRIALPVIVLSVGPIATDRPHHAHLGAGGAERGLHPHRAGDGHAGPRPSSSATPCATPRCRWSRSPVSASAGCSAAP